MTSTEFVSIVTVVVATAAVSRKSRVTKVSCSSKACHWTTTGRNRSHSDSNLLTDK